MRRSAVPLFLFALGGADAAGHTHRWSPLSTHPARLSLLHAGSPDEYQDGRSAGSLVQARLCWLDLLAADALPLPQRFRFVFGCPTEGMAVGLTGFLRYTPFAGLVRSADAADVPAGAPWPVTGTTQCAVWSLSSLEHLFMHLRGAGGRYESALTTLILVPAAPCLP